MGERNMSGLVFAKDCGPRSWAVFLATVSWPTWIYQMVKMSWVWVLVSYGCCNKLTQNQWLLITKTHSVTVLRNRHLNWVLLGLGPRAKIKVSAGLIGFFRGPRGVSVPGLFQLLEAACVPRLAAASFSSLPPWSHGLFLFCFLPLPHSFKDLWDYVGPT